MLFVILRLTSLSMTISRSMHVAANGIISFFFMTELHHDPPILGCPTGMA